MISRRVIRLAGLAALSALIPALPQSKVMTQGTHRIEIMLERLDSGKWHTIDPGLVLAQGDRVRFRFRTNFDGFLYVTNQSTSGEYQQLFPTEETGKENRITASQDYQVPATSTVFRVAGPAGYEVVYWLLTPAKLTEAPPRLDPVPSTYRNPSPITLVPRCDDTILRARGDCIDHEAGPKLVPRDIELPQTLAQAAGEGRRDLVFMRQQDKSVISSPAPLSGPVIYEFRLAHR